MLKSTVFRFFLVSAVDRSNLGDMKPAFQIGEIVYAKTNRNNVGQVIGIMQRVRSYEYEVKLADLNIEMFDEFELTKERNDALAPIEDEDA